MESSEQSKKALTSAPLLVRRLLARLALLIRTTEPPGPRPTPRHTFANVGPFECSPSDPSPAQRRPNQSEGASPGQRR
eukprot:1921973-Pyramimonas_sp.AAC.1